MRSEDVHDRLHDYVLTAYFYGQLWEGEGIAAEMIFGATFLANQSAFRHEVDLFTAALRLGLTNREAKRVNVKRCARACEYARLHGWSLSRFELELLRYGVWGVAKLVDRVKVAGNPVAVRQVPSKSESPTSERYLGT